MLNSKRFFQNDNIHYESVSISTFISLKAPQLPRPIRRSCIPFSEDYPPLRRIGILRRNTNIAVVPYRDVFFNVALDDTIADMFRAFDESGANSLSSRMSISAAPHQKLPARLEWKFPGRSS
jgi:hypothetical protein